MNRIKAIIILIILGMSVVTVAIAENNTTTDNVTTTATMTVTPIVQITTQPVQTTVQQPVQTTVQPAETEKKFRIGPTVRIRPLNDKISKNQDGLVELYFDNPSLNDVSLTVDARVSVPSGIHVYGQGFGEATAAGMVYGKFDVPPGSARTINIVIKADRAGDFNAQFTGTYYPDGNKDKYQPISLTHPFFVSEASADPNDPGTTVQTDQTPAAKSPGMTALLSIFAIVILAYITRRR